MTTPPGPADPPRAPRDRLFSAMVATALLLLALGLVHSLARRPEALRRSLTTALAFPLTLAEVERGGLSLTPARYWEELEAGVVQCRLCPHACRIAPSGRGLCRVRWNREGSLVTLVHGRPLALRPDPVEKKPLYHVEPGTTSFSLATAGCNLGCLFCQNWTISQAFPEKADCLVLFEGRFVHRRGFVERLPGDRQSSPITPRHLVKAALACNAASVAYTYTEPTVYYEYMLETAKEARAAGLRNLWITCGYISEPPLRELAPWLDAANVDLKGFSDTFYRQYCGGRLAPVLATLKVLREEGVWVEVTNLLIPDANDSDDMIRDLARWVVRDLGPGTPVHFSRFHPDYRLTDRSPTPLATLKRARRIARAEGLTHVYLGNVRDGEGSTTRCAGCGGVLVARRGYEILAYRLTEAGTCPACGRKAEGLWRGREGQPESGEKGED